MKKTSHKNKVFFRKKDIIEKEFNYFRIFEPKIALINNNML